MPLEFATHSARYWGYYSEPSRCFLVAEIDANHTHTHTHTHSPEKSDHGNVTRDTGVGSPQTSEKTEGEYRAEWPRQPRSQPLGPPHGWERGTQDVSSGPH